jgi:hypothetical protein
MARITPGVGRVEIPSGADGLTGAARPISASLWKLDMAGVDRYRRAFATTSRNAEESDE